MLCVVFAWLALFAYAAAKGRNISLFSVFYNLPITLAFGALAFDLLNRALTLGWTRFFKHHERPDVLDDAPGPSPWYLRAGKPLCHSSAVEESPPVDRSNLALLVAHPREGTYELFPQDWFNSARLDYGYQGVTRVARDPRTGRIHGEGTRISPFVLDDTLQNRL